MAKVLIVEDDQDLANMVRSYLVFEHHAVEMVGEGGEANDRLKTFAYDLIVLDWGLPGLSGLDILRQFRSRGGTTPILMLTGKDTLVEKESGLDAGADDYLTKPFHMKEFGARVRALLRRAGGRPTENILAAADLTLDVSKYQAAKSGKAIALVRKEFQLLEFLMRHPNQVFNAEALLNRVWPSDSEATPEALRSTMKRLRKKMDPDGEIIKTIHGVGYILENS